MLLFRQVRAAPAEARRRRASNVPGESTITLRTYDQAARVQLYAGQPHGEPIVPHGPFIGDMQADIMRLYQEYRQGKMPHLNDLPAERRMRFEAVA